MESQKWAIRQAEVHADDSVVRDKSKIQQGFFWGSAIGNTSKCLSLDLAKLLNKDLFLEIIKVPSLVLKALQCLFNY